MIDISELTGKISALKVFKEQINTALENSLKDGKIDEYEMKQLGGI